MGLEKNIIWKWGMIAAFLLCGCARLVPQPDPADDIAVSELREGVYEISFEGTQFTDLKEASDLTLLAAAETALNRGYPYFTIQKPAQEPPFPEIPTTAGDMGSYITTTTPRSSDPEFVAKAKTKIIIRGFKSLAAAPGETQVYQAEVLQRAIRTIGEAGI